jgi:flagellum-specific peptidoglycan hydrolase FlgJ
MGNRYKKCRDCGDDYKCWAKYLKRCGYATSKTYDKKLIKIIKKYKLYEYDKKNPQV